LEQIYVPPGRQPWQPRSAELELKEAFQFSVQGGFVTVRTVRHGCLLGPSSWSCRCRSSQRERRGEAAEPPVAARRRRQRERVRWRALVHELNATPRSESAQWRRGLEELSREERAGLRSWLKKEAKRWRGLAAELAQLSGWARKERLASLTVEDRSGFQQWLQEQKQRSSKTPCHGPSL
ncbi:unnamed protein product, partial [Polarella glacialis]